VAAFHSPNIEIKTETKSEKSRRGRFRIVGGMYICGKRYVGKMSRHAWCGRGFATEELAAVHHESTHTSPPTPEDAEKHPICMWDDGKCPFVAKTPPFEKCMDDHIIEHLKVQDDAVSGTMLQCQWAEVNGALCSDSFTRKDTKKFSQHVKTHVQQASTQAGDTRLIVTSQIYASLIFAAILVSNHSSSA
jgi:hypothetical protein